MSVSWPYVSAFKPLDIFPRNLVYTCAIRGYLSALINFLIFWSLVAAGGAVAVALETTLALFTFRSRRMHLYERQEKCAKFPWVSFVVECEEKYCFYANIFYGFRICSDK